MAQTSSDTPLYDLFVIGAGSGGVRCARIAAQHGASVGIAESRHWGGTCVNLGCVPKKLMVYASEYPDMIDDAVAYGWDAAHGEHDWTRLIDAKDREIERLNGIYVKMLGKAGVALHTGRATINGVDADGIFSLEIGPSPLAPDAAPQSVRARRVVIATGSHPVRPPIAGAEHAIVSDDAFHLPQRPERVCIVGSGYIGVEFASIFAGLESHVDLVYRQDRPLRGFDDELRTHLAEMLPGRGIVAHPKASPVEIAQDGEGYRVVLDNGGVIETDCVFLATGRKPNIGGLGLEALGVALPDGRIAVDEASQTNRPGLYAIGDVTDRHNLTPTAIAEGHILAEHLFGEKQRAWSFDTTPKAVFFTPALASCGLTEDEAAAGDDIEIFSTSFTPLRQTISGRETKVFMKLVVRARDQVVVGAHMIGGDAAEVMQAVAICITGGLTKHDFDRTIGIHPTSAEELVTMRSPTRHVPQRGAAS
ncbi:glutathione-disulfide reductase [Tanticharoenia sakaeratensis]|uniref:Glutathione reductase n=1 Tax=Tanticharoenia sakaeratensis NBRC 103193 TaxID=1231623 RepID=A0A0D6ML50_9PROT|nr:glutathione-disulfide reductase [Tanticharoenia sakaeratensis]GAN54206.1 glutathione reductase [Tanticharoenia sakaeratensis NBRC 103193]GBQ19284.1 glutathione reductase [Tanticharoenia sakaeratensis NBRC 103193]